MTRFSRLLATALLFAGGTPAFAAPVAATPQAKGEVLILRPLSFVRVTDLDFGTVVSSNTAGTVTINPSTGARSIAGGLTAMPIAPGSRGYFAGAGSGNQLVIINMTPATQLTNSNGDTIAVAVMFLDGATTRTIHPTTLAFNVGVGGTILVAANQPDGDYESTFDITADYQ